jgi:hypothetical protein
VFAPDSVVRRIGYGSLRRRSGDIEQKASIGHCPSRTPRPSLLNLCLRPLVGQYVTLCKCRGRIGLLCAPSTTH